MRSFTPIVVALAFLTAPPSHAAPPAGTGSASVTCRVTHDVHEREFRLIRSSGVWQLEMRGKATGGQWVVLPLPDAAPVFQNGTASLSYRSAYGGRTVTLQVSPAASSLDVYANYELEVNVNPDLNPRIDLLNTNGPLTDLTCRIAAP